jgi:hypothetical protein
MKGCYLEKWLVPSSVLIALFSSNLSAAQVVGDTTLPAGERSQVTGNPNFQIDGGATRGGNLFHSFSEFSIPTGGSAYFNNAADIQNILTRVTGGSISIIDGLIGQTVQQTYSCSIPMALSLVRMRHSMSEVLLLHHSRCDWIDKWRYF